MTDESILIDFDPNDFLIRLNPVLDEDGYWAGDVAVGIITTPENDLDDDDFDNMMYLTMLVTSSLPLMEENIEFRKALAACAKRFHDAVEHTEQKPRAEKLEGNVIKVNF